MESSRNGRSGAATGRNANHNRRCGANGSTTGAVKLWKQDVRFFMPRIGIAYRPMDKWVIRTGVGWFDNIKTRGRS